MRYDSWRYLYPPRPETATASTTLPYYEAKGWLAQPKFNGTSAVLFVPPGEAPTLAMGRHGENNRLQWQPGARWEAFRASLGRDRWYVFVGELLHSKGVGVRDTVALHDMLVEDGEYLLNTSYGERLAWLAELLPDDLPGVWRVPTYTAGFAGAFERIRRLPGKPTIEGLVLKRPQAKLAPCGWRAANSRWMHKCRVATDNLSF
jgi:hypothetical protein